MDELKASGGGRIPASFTIPGHNSATTSANVSFGPAGAWSLSMEGPMQNDVRTLLDRIGQPELAYLEYSVPSNLETARRWPAFAALLDQQEAEDPLARLLRDAAAQ
jgi:hypothetical protein